MAVSTFLITNILVSGDIRFVGRYKGEPTTTTREVIVRPGSATTDLAMKKGQGGWELEVLLPPLTYAVFAALVGNIPKECRFDRSENPSEFQVSYVYGNGTRTVTTNFVLT
jgi:hypothetical protein